MELQDLLFILSPIGVYITHKEWRHLVATAEGNIMKIIGRIMVLNSPIIALLILAAKGEI